MGGAAPQAAPRILLFYSISHWRSPQVCMHTRNRGFQVIVNAHLSQLRMQRDRAGRRLSRGTPLAFVKWKSVRVYALTAFRNTRWPTQA